MGTPAIEVDEVSKRYRRGAATYTTLQELVAGRLRRTRPESGEVDEVWALRDLTFGVDEGEAVGVIGHNGAGKTTLLKLLCRITQPTFGVSRTRGRLGALLDVGAGFHQELTGRENVYLNGAILGMSRSDIGRRFDEIIEFAGLEGFLETPLKRYSWGMSLRLAFSIAAHVEPEIVVVDEVLSVGDVRFRDKCLKKTTEFGRDGRTVIFVSHDLGSVNQVCRRTIWLEGGRIRADGRTEDVIEQYVRSSVEGGSRADFARRPGKPVQLLSVAITNVDGQELDTPRRDETLVLRVRFAVLAPIPGIDVVLSLRNQQGVRVLNEDWGVDTGEVLVPDKVPSEYEAALTVPAILPAGEYMVGVEIGTRFDLFVSRDALGFRLWPHPDDDAQSLDRDRTVQPAVQWGVAPVPSEASTDGWGDPR